MHSAQARLRLAVAAAALALGACASVPPPKDQIAVARAAVEEAQRANAAQFAPVESSEARRKLDQAEVALRQQEYTVARRLAEASEADARLALARANAERAERAAQEVEESNRALRQELQRTSGSGG